MTPVGKIVDTIERLVFGATAQERVDMMAQIIQQRVEARIVAALEADDEDESAEPEQEA